MKKNILKNLSLAFCICLLSAPASAQIIPDPGNDPLSDSLSTVESMTAHFWKTPVFKNGIINEATHQHNFSLNHTYVLAGEQSNGLESNKKQSDKSNPIHKQDLYFQAILKKAAN